MSNSLPEALAPRPVLDEFLKNFPFKYLGVAWQLNQLSGWGVYGFNLVIQLEQLGICKPVLFTEPDTGGWVNPLHRIYTEPALARRLQLIDLLSKNPDEQVSLRTPLLFAIGNQLQGASPGAFPSPLSVGMVFLEDSNLTPEALERGRGYGLLIAGSNWNADVLKNAGLTNVACVQQGIDNTVFHPAPRCNFFRNRFVVFSGGKLEFRKGQDIVVAAFRKFQTRHPDALLMTAWHNLWPQFMAGLESVGHVNGLPAVEEGGRLAIEDWLIKNGIPGSSILDLGAVPNYLMGQIVREADVAVFPNRCEGGTNLVAMECMACGLPTILSANSGHFDLIQSDNCYPLTRQGRVQPASFFSGTDGWGETDVDELVETLETAYQNRDAARERGAAAARFMQNWTWEQQTIRFLKVLGERASSLGEPTT